MARSKKSRRGSRKYRGGNGNAPNPSSYSSGASYVKAVVGGEDTQYKNVFGQSNNSGTGNAIVGLQGQKAGSRRKHSKRSKRGGFWGSVIDQAIVPFAILGMQQSYRRKRHGGNKTRKH